MARRMWRYISPVLEQTRRFPRLTQTQISRTLLLLFLPLTLLAPIACQEERTKPTYNGCQNSDSPECDCFKDFGSWDPDEGMIQDVALSTLDTTASCVSNGGKPYYQMCLGLNDPQDAQLFAGAFEDSADSLPSGFAQRRTWCTETISYWHRESRIPYNGGYRNSEWLFDWQLDQIYSLRFFYEAEEATGGRGRWIHWSDLDYTNFTPGVNAPAPGSPVIIRGYHDDDGKSAYWDGLAHAMMIDEMTVFRSASGEVTKVSATFLEGNAMNRVVNNRYIGDLLSVTPQGDMGIDERKIVGFGVDLDSSGNPIFDKSRLHWGRNQENQSTIPSQPTPIDEAWDSTYAPLIEPLAQFVSNLRQSGGPKITCSNCETPIEGFPDGDGNRWDFYETPEFAESEIVIDLHAVHPIPVLRVLLQWSGTRLPHGYRLFFASSTGFYEEATVPDIGPSQMAFQDNGFAAIPIPIQLGQDGELIRYLKLVFPKRSLEGVWALEEIRFVHKWQLREEVLLD